jgi:hypothetical protein
MPQEGERKEWGHGQGKSKCKCGRGEDVHSDEVVGARGITKRARHAQTSVRHAAPTHLSRRHCAGQPPPFVCHPTPTTSRRRGESLVMIPDSPDLRFWCIHKNAQVTMVQKLWLSLASYTVVSRKGPSLNQRARAAGQGRTCIQKSTATTQPPCTSLTTIIMTPPEQVDVHRPRCFPAQSNFTSSTEPRIMTVYPPSMACLIGLSDFTIDTIDCSVPWRTEALCLRRTRLANLRATETLE